MIDDHAMRTTVDIDEDILQAAKEVAANRGVSIGKVLSDWARKATEPRMPEAQVRNGVPLLPRRGGVKMTMEMVNELRDGDDE
jgi:hypothetical protein